MPAPESSSRNPRNLPDVYRPLWQQTGTWARRQLIQGLGGLEVQLQGWLTQLEAQQAAESNRVTLRSLAVTAIARCWLGLLRQWRLWNTTLVQLKRRLPWLRGIPNGVLTLGLGLLVAGLIWGAVAFWSSSPSLPDDAPDPTPTLLPTSQPLPSASEPGTSPPPESTGQSADRPEATDTPMAAEPSVPAPPTVQPSQPSQGESSPPAALPPTLDQRLLNQLQVQLQEAGDRPTAALLEAVQPQGPRLAIVLGSKWSSLSPVAQDVLAARLQDLSRDLGFESLALLDPHGGMLARSPVVGDKMVILQRRSAVARN